MIESAAHFEIEWVRCGSGLVVRRDSHVRIPEGRTYSTVAAGQSSTSPDSDSPIEMRLKLVAVERVRPPAPDLPRRWVFTVAAKHERDGHYQVELQAQDHDPLRPYWVERGPMGAPLMLTVTFDEYHRARIGDVWSLELGYTGAGPAL